VQVHSFVLPFFWYPFQHDWLFSMQFNIPKKTTVQDMYINLIFTYARLVKRVKVRHKIIIPVHMLYVKGKPTSQLMFFLLKYGLYLMLSEKYLIEPKRYLEDTFFLFSVNSNS